MKDLSLTLIQTSPRWEDAVSNRHHFEDILARVGPTDIIALPEMFTTGFTMNAPALSENPFGETHRWMVEMAERKGACVTGSYIVSEYDMYYNRLVWAYPDGSYQLYNKKHLFRMAGENNFYTAGISRTLVEYQDWKILPLVCYDLRFPAWCRNHYHHSTESLDYDLVLVVANWPAVRSQAWDTLLKARAIENHAYSAGVNRVGTDGTGKHYNGHSGVYDPRGNTLAFSENEEVLQITLSHEDLDNYRAKFPAYLDSND